MNNHSDYTFSLYVSGINLKEINPLESAKLLEALCKMLGAKHLKWGDIKEGSADYAVKVDPEYFDEKVDNFNKAVSEKTGPIKTILKHAQYCAIKSLLIRNILNSINFKRKMTVLFSSKKKL
jgi:hypothetical protein